MNINYFQKSLLILYFSITTLIAMEDNKAIIPIKSIFIPTANTPQANAELSKIVKLAFMNLNTEDWSPKAYFFEKTLQEIEICLQQNANPNSKFGFDKTPLIALAVKYQIKDLFDLLLRYGADINTNDIYKRTPLHILIYNFKDDPNIVNVNYLLQNKANPNAKTNENLTPLSLAIWYPHLGYAEPLIKYRANVNNNNDEKNTNTNTPLKYAINNQDIKAIEILCNAGALLTELDHCNNTAFHLIANVPNIDVSRKIRLIETVMTQAQPDFKKNHNSINTILVTLFILKNYAIPIPPDLQFKILSKLVIICFHTGLYYELLNKNYKQLPLELVKNHVKYLQHVIETKNNQTPCNPLGMLYQYSDQTYKKQVESYLNGNKLQEDLKIFNKVYPDISSIHPDNLALQILENHYAFKPK